MNKYDVVRVKIGFSQLPVGTKGVCLGAVKANSGVMKLSILMENERMVTLTGKEIGIFFDNLGTLRTHTDDRERLLKSIRNPHL